LLDKAKQHANQEHEGTYSEVDLRVLIDTSAYDVAGESAS
jgi:hypothetical protein